jgi:hypothetical protein
LERRGFEAHRLAPDTLFNLVRRCLTDSLFSAGIPWPLADEAIAGVAYLLVWIWVVRQLEAPAPHATV